MRWICENPYCLKEFEARPNQAFCSMECRVQNHRYWKTMSGEAAKAAKAQFTRAWSTKFFLEPRTRTNKDTTP